MFRFYCPPSSHCTAMTIHLVRDSYVGRVPDNDHGFDSQCVKTKWTMIFPGRIHPPSPPVSLFMRDRAHTVACDSPCTSPPLSISRHWLAVPIGAIMGAHDKFLCIHKKIKKRRIFVVSSFSLVMARVAASRRLVLGFDVLAQPPAQLDIACEMASIHFDDAEFSLSTLR